jgi:hypothetical protein
MSFLKNREEEDNPGLGLVPMGGGMGWRGNKEKVLEGEYGRNIMFSYMKMEK